MTKHNPRTMAMAHLRHDRGTSQDRSKDWLATAFVVLAFIMTSSAFYEIFAGSGRGGLPGTGAGNDLGGVSARNNPVYLLMWGTLYAMILWGLLVTIMRKGVQPALLCAGPLMVLIFLSMAWSVNAATTGFYGLMLTLNILLGLVLSQLTTPRRLLRILALLLIFMLAISLFLFALAPQLVSDDRFGGGWLSSSQLVGVFAHKSDAGYYFAILILLMSQGAVLGFSAATRLVVIATAFIAILFTNSATALLAAILVMSLLWLFRGRSQFGSLVLGGAAALAIAFSVLVPYIDLGSLTSFVGRDAGLTGRSEIWSLATRYIQERPLLGYGYYGFFDKDVYSPLWSFWEHFDYFFTPHFHNSAIDVTISLGVVGLALYIAHLTMAFAIAANYSIDHGTRRLCFGILLILTITACFDFTMMKHNSFATAFLFYCFFAGQTRYDEGAT